MAEENTQGQNVGGVNTEDTTNATAQNTGDDQSSASPAGQTDSELAALKAQLERERERSQYLEQSLRIQEKFLQSREQAVSGTSSAKPDVSGDWTPEMDVLDKALEPVLRKRLNSVTDPLNATTRAVLEDNDALRFEMFLSRNNPELLEDEDAYARTMQTVEQIRQTAAQRGMNVSRIDAFVFNEGLQGTRQKTQQRKQRKSTAAQAETRRQTEARTAQATTSSSEPRTSQAAAINEIRSKAQRGERLSDAERTRLREWVSGVEF